jgi:hypothetical protein
MLERGPSQEYVQGAAGGPDQTLYVSPLHALGLDAWLYRAVAYPHKLVAAEMRIPLPFSVEPMCLAYDETLKP